MSNVSTPVVACDDCGTRRQGKRSHTFADIRQILAEVGWRCDHANDTDFCPSCLAKGAGS